MTRVRNLDGRAGELFQHDVMQFSLAAAAALDLAKQYCGNPFWSLYYSCSSSGGVRESPVDAFASDAVASSRLFSLKRTTVVFEDLKERVMISERLAQDGEWLFKHRGILPLFLLIPGLWSLSHFQYLAGSHSAQHIWDWVCLSVSILGLIVRATTVGFVDDGTSGRNTACQIATELNTTGWYSMVRNPLYLGNFLIMMGIIIVPADLALMAVTGCLFWIYYERIISAEESFLSQKFGDSYTAWSRSTPVFLPRLSGWVSPSRTFRLRMVLRREYCAVLLIGIAFLLLNFLEHMVAEHRYYADPEWMIFFGATLSVFLTLRTLKKKTTILNLR